MTTHLQPVMDLIKTIATPTPTTQGPKENPRPSRIVQVDAKSQYGSMRFYPANAQAWCFLKIQGGRTLTQDTLRHARELGYRININQEEIKL